MRTLLELVTVDHATTRGPARTPPRRRRGEPSDPKEGVYWVRAGSRVAITGTANEIVFLSGQVVLADPAAFGLTEDEIMAWLTTPGEDDHTTTGDYAPAQQYRRFLDDPSHDLSGARLWRASRVVYQRMLQTGWAWVHYAPPELIHIVVIPAAAKRQLATAAEHFPLLQIDHIAVTLVTTFKGLIDRFPELSGNRTLQFSKAEFAGFAGSFGGALDWASGKEAPESNYFYALAGAHAQAMPAEQRSVKTANGYRQRWAVRLFARPPAVPPGQTLVRISRSVVNKIAHSKHWLRGVTPETRNAALALFSDRWFEIGTADMEVLRAGHWQPADRSAP